MSLSPCVLKSSWCRSTLGMGECCRSCLRGLVTAPGSKNHRRAAMGSGSHSPDFTSSYQLATDSKSSWPEVCEAAWHQLQASHTSSPDKLSYVLQSPWQAGLRVGTVCIGDDVVYNDANKRLTQITVCATISKACNEKPRPARWKKSQCNANTLWRRASPTCF